jgi:peptidoglycan/LPS O-acetylase OafA/YrhL
MQVATENSGAHRRHASPAAPVAEAPAYRGYFPAVDGLRGLTVLSVLLYHSGWFSSGFFGVDIFMVLSGFLITLVLLREAQRQGRFAIGAFYVRRFKRLTPGLVTTLLGTVLLGYLCGTLSEARQIAWQAVSALAQVANWEQIRHDPTYWTRFGQVNPLSPMWSLSITEQFYLVWPLLLTLILLLTKHSSVARTTLLVLLLGGSAAVAPLLYDGANSGALYLNTFVRLVDFVAGATAASVVHSVYLSRARQGIERPAAGATPVRSGPGTLLLTGVGAVALAGLVAASALTHSYHDAWLYRGGLAGVAATAAVLVASLCHDRGPLVRLFSMGPLVEMGKLSYAMYLVHLPVYWLLLKAEPTIRPYALFLMGGFATWLISLLMHYLLTERVRRLPWRPVLSLPLLSAGCLLVVFGAQLLPGYVSGGIDPGGKPVVLLLGDSFTTGLAGSLTDDGTQQYRLVDDGVSDCGIMGAQEVEDAGGSVVPVTAKCRAWNRVWAQQIGSVKPSVIVVHLDWDATAQRVGGSWLTPCQSGYQQRYESQLTEAAAIWQTLAPGVPVLLSNDRTATGDVPQQWGICYDNLIDGFARAHAPQVHLLDLESALCPKSVCTVTVPGGGPVFSGDGVDLTPAGQRLVEPFLRRSIAAVLG